MASRIFLVDDRCTSGCGDVAYAPRYWRKRLPKQSSSGAGLSSSAGAPHGSHGLTRQLRSLTEGTAGAGRTSSSRGTRQRSRTPSRSRTCGPLRANEEVTHVSVPRHSHGSAEQGDLRFTVDDRVVRLEGVRENLRRGVARRRIGDMCSSRERPAKSALVSVKRRAATKRPPDAPRSAAGSLRASPRGAGASRRHSRSKRRGPESGPPLSRGGSSGPWAPPRSSFYLRHLVIGFGGAKAQGKRRDGEVRRYQMAHPVSREILIARPLHSVNCAPGPPLGLLWWPARRPRRAASSRASSQLQSHASSCA